MNIFRLIGDLTHLMSIIVLLLKIHTIKSCSGTLCFITWGKLS
jgi:ER lumen protein retaining receptor